MTAIYVQCLKYIFEIFIQYFYNIWTRTELRSLLYKNPCLMLGVMARGVVTILYKKLSKIKKIMYEYCIYILQILYKYCANIVQILYRYCANIVEILYEYFANIV